MTAIEETPPLQADLPDILRLVAELATVQPMGRRGRQILFELAAAGADVEHMDGLVVLGEAYTLYRIRQEWAPCGCRDGKHEFSTDAPWFKRGYWTEKAEAQKTATKLRGHVVTHLVADTPMEVVR